jgi:hypothetical protein
MRGANPCIEAVVQTRNWRRSFALLTHKGHYTPSPRHTHLATLHTFAHCRTSHHSHRSTGLATTAHRPTATPPKKQTQSTFANATVDEQTNKMEAVPPRRRSVREGSKVGEFHASPLCSSMIVSPLSATDSATVRLEPLTNTCSHSRPDDDAVVRLLHNLLSHHTRQH